MRNLLSLLIAVLVVGCDSNPNEKWQVSRECATELVLDIHHFYDSLEQVMSEELIEMKDDSLVLEARKREDAIRIKHGYPPRYTSP